MNHYATNTFFDHGGRHYYFAKYLMREGYDVTVFCASTVHNSDKNIEVPSGKYTVDFVDGIPYVFVKTPSYTGNGKKRIQNMFSFYRNLFPVTKSYGKETGWPDVILASSVHPLTLVAGIKIAKRLGIPCICEIRDLWPESLVAYGILKSKSIITNILYKGEKYIYKHADKIIMTWPGGYDYIVERGWNKQIPSGKVQCISNGIDLESFQYNLKNYIYDDDDLKNSSIKKFVYAGSIRKVNNISILINAVEVLNRKGFEDKFILLIYGDGTEREQLGQCIREKKIQNVKLKGKVEKNFIPSILSQSDISILHNTSTPLDRFGQSQNKFFEYLAVGHPVLMTYSVNYSICRKMECGIEIEHQVPEEIAEAMELLINIPNHQYQIYCENSKKAAEKYDFAMLTDRLIQIMEEINKDMLDTKTC